MIYFGEDFFNALCKSGILPCSSSSEIIADQSAIVAVVGAVALIALGALIVHSNSKDLKDKKIKEL